MKFIETLKNVWKIEELRNRIIITLGLLLVYRFGAQVVLPGIDAQQLEGLQGNTEDGLLGLLNAFTGGAFANASVFALGIMPYISASIVVQLMGIAIPYLQKLQKEGASGQKKITQITRWLTIAICLVQAPGYLASLPALGIPQSAFLLGQGGLFYFSSVIILVTGCIFAMWLGEKITDKGIGNGISLIIMIGIIAQLPTAFFFEFGARLDSGGLVMFLVEIVFLLLVTIATILLIQGTRRVPVNFAKKVVGNKQYGGVRQYIPLKVNAAGVMPIIFAQALMFVPITVAGFSESDLTTSFAAAFADITGFWYNFVFAVLIIAFTYFYTAITVPTNKMADDLKRSGGFIPGIRPGVATTFYLKQIMKRVTFLGAIMLAMLATLPNIIEALLHISSFNGLGTTSLLILVGVILDITREIRSILLTNIYNDMFD